jgi:hypothetical protein
VRAWCVLRGSGFARAPQDEVVCARRQRTLELPQPYIASSLVMSRS